MNRSFYVIDCSYYFRASYFALPPIYSPSGILVNAVYGFISTVLKLLKERNPHSLAVADDAHGHYFRHDLLPSYKSEKKPVPIECDQQIPILRRVLKVMAIPYINVNRFEADDAIATLTVEARRNGFYTYICSRDKDLQQLIAGDVVILDLGSYKEMTCAKLRENKGILPAQIPDMLALVGDKVDSIPGIPGIGPKTAIKLLNSYDTLENVVQHFEELGGKIGATIKEHRQQAFVAKKLAILRADVPIDVNFSALTFKAPNIAVVEPVFKELGFEILLKRLKGLFK